MPKYPKDIEYADYNDDTYYYRNVRLPHDIYKKIPSKGKIMTEEQWRSLGIKVNDILIKQYILFLHKYFHQQKSSKGWQHYCVYKPELYVIMLRKPINFQ